MGPPRDLGVPREDVLQPPLQVRPDVLPRDTRPPVTRCNRLHVPRGPGPVTYIARRRGCCRCLRTPVRRRRWGRGEGGCRERSDLDDPPPLPTVAPTHVPTVQGKEGPGRVRSHAPHPWRPAQPGRGYSRVSGRENSRRGRRGGASMASSTAWPLRGSARRAETCPVSTGGRDETCPASMGGSAQGRDCGRRRAARHLADAHRDGVPAECVEVLGAVGERPARRHTRASPIRASLTRKKTLKSCPN